MAKIKEAVKEIGLSDETLIIPVYSDVNDEACSVDDDGNAIFIEIDADGYSGKKETVRSAIKDAFGKMYKVYMR